MAGRTPLFDQVPRIEIVADEPTLTPFAVVGELVRRLGLIPALDNAIDSAPRLARRRRPWPVRRPGAGMLHGP
jgi:hypothetical protein